MMKHFLFLFISFLATNSYSQLIDVADIPNFKYTRKSFVVNQDSLKFKNSPNQNQGLSRVYVSMNLSFFDLDDSKKYVTNIQQFVLACIEGYYISGKRNGRFTHYILDSLNPNVRFKIWEQNFKNDKLYGISQAYTLQGKLAAQYEYKDDSLIGKSVLYAADGRSALEEIIYDKQVKGKYVKRNYNDTSGKLEREENYEKYELNGKARDFYPGGQVEIEEFFIDGKLNGSRKHFYPSGQRWTEVEYRNGKIWTALGSYLENGRPLYPGSLINGSGVLHIYDKYGIIQESYMYMKGELVK
jgi:antitoxin component YwqK of YwqJK toxin-antitoxin module